MNIPISLTPPILILLRLGGNKGKKKDIIRQIISFLQFNIISNIVVRSLSGGL